MIHIADVRFAEQVWYLWRNNQSYKKKNHSYNNNEKRKNAKSREKKHVGINNI